MHLCVIVQGEDNLATAGVRIRYQRTAVRLAALGDTLSITVIDDVVLDPKNLADAYLICKCHDARATLLAAKLRALGRHVGADFFDDYYSQADDSRFVYIREWLRQTKPFLTFAMCSTPLMQETIAGLLPGLPCHMLNDPADVIDTQAIAASIERKLQRVRQTGILDIGWFGIGDNPHFPLGLSDLADFSGQLGELAATGLTPRLSILTNRRALTPERLEMLKRLPIAWRLEEWSEEAERQLITESYACVIPVNAQRFSTMKSLNRAVSALTSGAQVLSLGYPLYENFAPLIYRDAAALLADIRKAAPRLSAASVPVLAASLAAHADPAEEARRLSAFLAALPPHPPLAGEDFAVLHGRQSSGAVHKFVQRMGGLSVAGPWTTMPMLNYDLRIGPGASGGPAAIVSERALARLVSELAAMAKPAAAHGKGHKSFEIPLSALDAGAIFERPDPLLGFDSVFAACYGFQMNALEEVARRLFGAVNVIVSEQASPFWRESAAPETAA